MPSTLKYSFALLTCCWLSLGAWEAELCLVRRGLYVLCCHGVTSKFQHHTGRFTGIA